MTVPNAAGSEGTHGAVDTLGHLLAWHVTAANEQDRTQAKQLAAQVQSDFEVPAEDKPRHDLVHV